MRFLAAGPPSAALRRPTPSLKSRAMRSEMHDLREMVSLSLMQQQSASERLKGVSWIGQIDRPSSELAVALLDALMHDPNVNVRLATVDALERFRRRRSRSAEPPSTQWIARRRRSCRSRSSTSW